MVFLLPQRHPVNNEYNHQAFLRRLTFSQATVIVPRIVPIQVSPAMHLGSALRDRPADDARGAQAVD
jgi:hypothetical protein